MKDHVYKLVELTGTSTTSIEDAVDKAIRRAHKTVKKPLLVPSGGNARQHRQGQGATLAGHHQGRLLRGKRSASLMITVMVRTGDDRGEDGGQKQRARVLW